MGIGNLFDSFEVDHIKITTFLKNSIDFLIIEENTLENENQEQSAEIEISAKNAITINTIGINLLQFIKMIISHLNVKDSSSTNSIVDGILEYSKIKVESFNHKMDLLKDRSKKIDKLRKDKIKLQNLEKDDLSTYSNQIQELEFELIDCISGVVNNITPYIHASTDEDTLFTLLGTHIEDIQKAAYLTLNNFYQNFIPPLRYTYQGEEIDEEELKKQFLKEEAQEETKEETKEENKEEAKEEVKEEMKVSHCS
jgi:hypothetical protein